MKQNQLKSVIFVDRPIQLYVMTIEQRKMELIAMMLKVRSESLINQMENLLKKEMIVAYTTTGEPLTLKQYKDRLDKAKKQVAEGKYTTQEDLEKKVKKW